MTKYSNILLTLFKEGAEDKKPDLPAPDGPIDDGEAPASGETDAGNPAHATDPNAVADNFLDPTTDAGALDTAGLPAQVQDAFEQLKGDLTEFSSKIDIMENDLVSNDPNSILMKLSRFATAPGVPPDYQKMAIALKKQFASAANALGVINTTLKVNLITADSAKAADAEANMPKGGSQ